MSGAISVVGLINEHKREIASASKPESRPSLDFSRRIPELDGLRGVAIGMVLYYHLVTIALVIHPHVMLGYFQTTTRLFWSGVDLFFLLSGFLIGGILLDARDSPNYFKTFYFRRCCRILPIYFLFLGLVGIAYVFVYRPVGPSLDWVFAGKLPWYSYLSFAQNLWMTKSNTPGATILGSTWSLAVEEQFYLVLPLVIRFVRRSALPYVLITGLVIAPILRLSVGCLFPTNVWANYSLLPCRMDPLLLGALCAYYLRQPGVWSLLVRQRAALWIMSLPLLAGMPILNIRWDTLKPVVACLLMTASCSWMAMFYAIVLLLALTDSRSLLSRVLRWPSLAALGAVAYSVYLFHSGVYGLCVWLFTKHEWLLASWKDLGVTLLAVAITIAFGKLSWRYFEKPIVRWGHTWQY
jgi:peptidoglycan/LPS O-acetylase OafA/YrhL